MEDYEKRSSHRSKCKKTLGEIRDSLLDHMIDSRHHMTFVGTFFVRVRDDFRHAERISVEGCLRDETVGEWNAEKACNTCGDTQEEYIPVEASWFAEWELSSLRDEGGDCSLLAMFSHFAEENMCTVMIEIKQDRE